MTSDKAAIVVKTVVKRTNEGKVPWTPTSTDEAFEASFANETLRIVRVNSVDDETSESLEIYHLEIINADGRIVDTIYPYEIRLHTKNAWDIVRTLYAKARDRALGVDKTVEGLLKDLGGAVGLDEADDVI